MFCVYRIFYICTYTYIAWSSNSYRSLENIQDSTWTTSTLPTESFKFFPFSLFVCPRSLPWSFISKCLPHLLHNCLLPSPHNAPWRTMPTFLVVFRDHYLRGSLLLGPPKFSAIGRSWLLLLPSLSAWSCVHMGLVPLTTYLLGPFLCGVSERQCDMAASSPSSIT